MPRPVTPVYSELSEILQVSLHRALTRQQEPRAALHEAAARDAGAAARASSWRRRVMSSSRRGTVTRRWRRGEARLAWALALPALGDDRAGRARSDRLDAAGSRCTSHDLRMPWLGRPFVGARQLRRGRCRRAFRERARRTRLLFAARHRHARARAAAWCSRWRSNASSRARGLVRTAVLLPWAIPTVVAALVWRFMFESPAGLVNDVAGQRSALTPPTWFADAVAAWVPIVLADVWKTTPFVALLLLAGLQNIDPLALRGRARRRRRAVAAVHRHHAAAAQAGAAGRGPVPRARRLPRVRPRLRDDRRRTGHRHRADRAVHVHHAVADICASATARRCR